MESDLRRHGVAKSVLPGGRGGLWVCPKGRRCRTREEGYLIVKGTTLEPVGRPDHLGRYPFSRGKEI